MFPRGRGGPGAAETSRTMKDSLAIRMVDGSAKAASAARREPKPGGKCEGEIGLLFQISELGCVVACRKDRD